MSSFSIRSRRRRRFFGRGLLVLVPVMLFGALAFGLNAYIQGLRPAGTATTEKMFVIGPGTSVNRIAINLQEAGLIRSAQVFRYYVSLHRLAPQFQAGTYKFAPSDSARSIAYAIAHGNVAADLVTILPAQRIDQVRAALIAAKFTPESVDAALDPANYASLPLLADKPAGASLEGYIYPDSYSKEGLTDPKDVVAQALRAMDRHLTPDIRAGFAAHGLSVYQGITMASILEKEVSTQDDRNQVAQVFYKRMANGQSLESDVTAFYGAIHDGQAPSVSYSSPYNTYKVKGLPIGPISNVSASSMTAVAHPADTDWLYFVAGDDGKTYFSKTLAEHQALTAQHCKKLCDQ